MCRAAPVDALVQRAVHEPGKETFKEYARLPRMPLRLPAVPYSERFTRLPKSRCLNVGSGLFLRCARIDFATKDAMHRLRTRRCSFARKDVAGAIADGEDIVVARGLQRVAHHQPVDPVGV